MDDGTTVSNEVFFNMSDDEDKLFIIGMGGRPGVSLFLIDLEYHYFIPGHPINDRFELWIKKWHDIGWAIIAVPMKFKDTVLKVAKRCDLKLADGIPLMLGGSPDESSKFPLKYGDNVFTLENLPDSKAYDPARVDEIEKQNKDKSNAIISKHLSTLGKMCEHCGCFHDDTFAEHHPKEVVHLREVCAVFDPDEKCILCRNPVGRLSMGGPNICAWCDCGQPPETPLEDRHAYYGK